MSAIPAWLAAAARELFADNRVTVVRTAPKGAPVTVTYHAPSLGSAVPLLGPFLVRFPHQWLWDSCAHAIALAELDPTAALAEVQALLAAQDEDGFIPHLIWNPRRLTWLDRLAIRHYRSQVGSRLTQTPGLAEATEAVLHAAGERGWLREVLPGVARYYAWLRERRRVGEGELLVCLSPLETGRDNAPEFARGFRLAYGWPQRFFPQTSLARQLAARSWDAARCLEGEVPLFLDLGFNCVYAANLRALSRLHLAAGMATEAARTEELANRTEADIQHHLNNPEDGLLYSAVVVGKWRALLTVSTHSLFFPLLLEQASRALVERLATLLRQPGFWRPFPAPAEPAEAWKGQPPRRRIWAGRQTFIYQDWYVVSGLRRQARRFPDLAPGLLEAADALAACAVELVRRAGFREYYDSETGAGHGARRFGPAALALDMLARGKTA